MSEKGRQTLFEKYAFILSPVRDAAGQIIAANFFREGVEISTASGLSNVRQHLADQYFIMLDEEDKKRLQPRSKKRRAEAGQATIDASGVSTSEAATIFAKGAALGCLPLSLPQNPGIQFIIRNIGGFSASFPSRQTVSRRVDGLYRDAAARVATVLKSARSSPLDRPVLVALTDDLWTSLSRRGHVGVNAYIINEDFEIIELALGCRHFGYPHDAQTIAEKVGEVMSESGLTPADLASITTDNEPTAVSSSRKLAAATTGILTCACHTLNLCGEHASKARSFAEALNTIQEVSTHFHSSVKRMEALAKKQNRPDALCFIKPAPTRWNYISDVVARAIANAEPIAALKPSDLDLDKDPEIAAFLSLQERYATAIVAVKPLADFLSNVFAVSCILSAERTVTASKIFAHMDDLWEKAEKLAHSDSSTTKDFAAVFRDQLNQRFYLQATSQLLKCAEFLDPCVAKRMIPDGGSPSAAEACVALQELRDSLANEFFPVGPPQAQGDSDATDVFGEPLSAESSPQSNAEFKKQCGKYLTAVRDEPLAEDCLQWWRKHRAQFPLVAFVARSVLCAQASSAGTERLFSTGGRVVNRFRTRLTGSCAEKLILLNRALPLMGTKPPHVQEDDSGSEDEAAL